MSVTLEPLVMIGVTADDPVTNLDRLSYRGDNTSDETLADAIRKFSLDDGYKKWANEADCAVLISVDSDSAFEVIHAVNRSGTFTNVLAFEKFESYGRLSVEDIVQQMYSEQKQQPSQEIDGLDQFAP